jgi:3D (Asp-Asp-Asp) domain-containing protein
MLLLSRSFRRKLLATALGSVVFFLVYEATVFDSRSAGVAGQAAVAAPAPGARIVFEVTSYCKGQTTASGVAVRAGIAAADPKVLPIGSVIEIHGVPSAFEGIYTVLDTGPAIQGRKLDLYVWSCYEALAFGRRQAQVNVLRLGWNQNQVSGR